MDELSANDSMSRPCLIVGHGDAKYAALAGRSFRRMGWDVYAARTGPEARRLARLLEPELMVLGTDLEMETGWLTCEKVTREMPRVKVFLVGEKHPRNNAFASFVGAVGLLDRRESIGSLVEEVCGRALPAAG